MFSKRFICATDDYSTYEHFVPSPYLRKSFTVNNIGSTCKISVCGLGFYRIWINGIEITKGLLAPYISNPDDVVYFDSYSLENHIFEGKNVIGFQLGNGMQNAPGGEIWDFTKASFRGSPRLAFVLEHDGITEEADESVKTAPSPVYFDDLRNGVRYDARNEITGWNTVGFNDCDWKNAISCAAPKGDQFLCSAEPVKPTGEILAPVSVFYGEMAGYSPAGPIKNVSDPDDDLSLREGFIFDFGKNTSGIPKLRIKGQTGQKIVLQFAEKLTDGKLDYSNISFFPDGYSQRDVYICGGKDEVFEPPFTYHGARYCMLTGLNEEQLKTSELSFIVYSSDIASAGSFKCSDERTNKIYDMCENSDRSNFFYFPTDCPHREKNGWTGDAALSARHMLMTMKCENSYREWMRNIRASQLPDGSIPAVIPTACNWGLGTGPSWDAVITEIPYNTYIYTGNKEILVENARAIFNYLKFASGRINEEGLVKYGLGDWCPVDGNERSSREYTCSVYLMDSAKKAAFIYGVLGMEEEKAFAERMYNGLRNALRKKYINSETRVADTGCQTSQALALYYGLFNDDEIKGAQEALIERIHNDKDFIDFGILGARAVFNVLSAADEAELAFKMITRPEYPSYGHWLDSGMTALAEDFAMENSLNHHMFGDIKAWFISEVAGLKWNENMDDSFNLTIAPHFIKSLTFAEASFDSPAGRIVIRWDRTDEGIVLKGDVPQKVKTVLRLPKKCFCDDRILSCGSFTAKIRE